MNFYPFLTRNMLAILLYATTHLNIIKKNFLQKNIEKGYRTYRHCFYSQLNISHTLAVNKTHVCRLRPDSFCSGRFPFYDVLVLRDCTASTSVWLLSMEYGKKSIVLRGNLFVRAH